MVIPEGPKNLVTRSKFARELGITSAHVTQACNGVIKSACVGKRIDLDHPDVAEYIKNQKKRRSCLGEKFNFDVKFGEAVEYRIQSGDQTEIGLVRALGISRENAKKLHSAMESAGLGVPDIDPVALIIGPKPTINNAGASPSEHQLTEIPEDISQFLNMTLNELIQRFGTDIRFLDWLKATKEIEMINERRIKNAQAEGKLVSRELVKGAVLAPIDGVFVKLLTDAATTIASRAHAMVNAGEPENALRAMVEDQLASFIRPAKSRMAEALANA